MYRYIESLYSVPGINILLQVSYTSKTSKLTEKKRSGFSGYRGRGGGLGEGSKKAKLPILR